MMLLKHIFQNRLGWGLMILALVLGVAAQCHSTALPLPTTPANPTVRIALLTPINGELAAIGRVMQNGIIMALEEWNRRGGVLNHRFEWVLYDTDCTFKSSQQATQQALDDGLRFIIGPICPEAAIATATLAESAQALTILPAATHPLVTVNHQGQTRSGIFRVSYTFLLQGRAAAYFAHSWLDVSKVAMLSNPGDDYSTALADAFARHFSPKGGEIVYQTTYSSDNIDFSEMLIAINQSEAELIYLPASPSVANQVANQLKELGISKASPSKPGLILLGSDSWVSTELDLAATANSYFPVHFSLEDNRPQVQSWADAYKSTYAIEPTTLAALGYDAANMLVEATRQTGSFEPTKVARTLEQSTFVGVTGQITFDDHHNPVKPVPFVQVQEGHVNYITSISP